jgi:hypothetical protein
MSFIRYLFVFMCFLPVSVQVQAEESTPFSMSFPLNCELHKDCWTLYYVDVNRTKDVVEDYSCGKRSYDQHKGTDFAIRDYHAMVKGTDVLAVSEGTVIRLRDGVKDNFKNKDELEAVRKAGVECGNGVFISHGNGFSTQYCHLKQDSIVVEKGDVVKRGQKIGQVGISGLAEHPHLHLSVYKGKELIDPFMGLDVEQDCSGDYTDSKVYWDESMPARVDQPEFYDSGFSAAMPNFGKIVTGQRGELLVEGSKAIIFWVSMFDIRHGDYITIKIVDQAGHQITTRTISHEGDKIRQHYAVGRKIAQGVPLGTYTGHVAITRVMNDGNTQTYRHSKAITLK